MNNVWLSCYLALVSRTYKIKRPPGCSAEMQNNRCGPGLCRAGMCCLDDEICWNGQVFLKYRMENIAKDADGKYTVTRSDLNYTKSQHNLI